MSKKCCSRQDHQVNENNEVVNHNKFSDSNMVVTNNANNDPDDKEQREDKENC